MSKTTHFEPVSRRAFLAGGSLLLFANCPASHSVETLMAATEVTDKKNTFRVGMITDLHYADKKEAGTRFYREAIGKLREAVAQFQRSKCDFVVTLGDIIDAADAVDVELGYLKTINGELKKVACPRHYVLGNHCVYTLTKEEFLTTVEAKKSYYAFEHQGYQFIVLDSCFTGAGKPYGRKNFEWTDPNIPDHELTWLSETLEKSRLPAVIFAHQRLDVKNHYGVKNAADVRDILEKSQRVAAVFQGHSHQNDYKEIGSVHYVTVAAMIEGSGEKNNAYTTLHLSGDGTIGDGTIRVTGFRRQAKYRFTAS